MLFRIFKFTFEFPPETTEALKFGNRLLDYLEGTKVAGLQQQVNDLVAQLKSSREPLKAAVDESSQA